MFTATRVAAVVAIVALGGSLALVAGPLGPSADTAPVPGAATSSPSPSPGAIDETYFTGVMTVGLEGVEGTTEVGPDDVIRNRGGQYDAEWWSTDPRFSGPGDYTGNTNDYKTGSDGVVSVGWGTMSVETEDGTWHSATPVGGVVRRPIATEIDTRIPVWFVGDGAYEGMTALVVYTIVPSTYPPFRWNYEGWIVPGDAHLTEMVE
jgi:hypothetical protein